MKILDTFYKNNLLFNLRFFALYSMVGTAQNLKIGFCLQAHQVRFNTGTGILGGNGLPLSLHFNADNKLFKDFSINGKIGRTFHLEFLGWEFGINGKYSFFKSLFLSMGILYHSNEGSGISNNEWTNYASLLMISPAIGVELSSVIALELSYNIPVSKKIIGGGRNFYSGEEKIVNRTFESMIRLGFVFGWELK